MTRKRLLPFFLLGSLLTIPLWMQTNVATAQQAWTPTLEQVKQAFPGSGVTPATMGRFKGMKVDLNGDGKKELILVENPNMRSVKSKAPKAANQCPCPIPKATGKAKRIARMLRKLKKGLHHTELIKVRRRRYDLRIWYSGKKSKIKTHEGWAVKACKALYRGNRRLNRYRVKRVIFVNMDNGETTRISYYRCKKLRRYRKTKTAKRRFSRWSRSLDKTTVPTCPCPKKKKKKKRVALPGASKALNIVVAEASPATTAPAGSPMALPTGKTGAISAASLLPKMKIVGRLRGESIRFVPLTQSGKILGIRIERTTQLGPRLPRTTMERIYIYDQGNSGRLKEVFKIKTVRESDDKDPGARQWVDLKFRQLDADAWLEITADAYYETPKFNGLIARRMFKWHRGKYVPLNTFRGILRARSNSTWKRVATRGSRMLKKRLQLRTSPVNVIDGFRNTPWVASQPKRSVGAWVRVDFMRTMPLLGVAIAAQIPNHFGFVVPKLFRGIAPKQFAPRYIRIRTSSGFQQTTAMKMGGGYTFVRFPTPVQTRYIEVKIVAQHRASGRTLTLTIPPKERSVGLLSEIVPIVDQIRYTASSFELKGSSMTPRQAGDHRSTTAWAEGRKDDGIGEWIQMVFPMPRTLQTLTIVNGCRRPGEKYILNNRVKNAKLTFSNGSVQNITLKDSHGPQKIKLNGVRTMSVMLTISSIYKGKLGHTTCLAELRP